MEAYKLNPEEWGVNVQPDSGSPANFAVYTARGEFVLEEISITCNKNTVPGDKSALNPSGITLGIPALTTRGLLEDHMDTVVDFIHRGLMLAKEIGHTCGSKLVDFKNAFHNDKNFSAKVKSLRDEVEKFSEKFPMPGCKDL